FGAPRRARRVVEGSRPAGPDARDRDPRRRLRPWLRYARTQSERRRREPLRLLTDSGRSEGGRTARGRSRVRPSSVEGRDSVPRGNAEIVQFGSHIFRRGRRLDLLVDRDDLAVCPDIKRPAVGKAVLTEHTVRLGRLLGRAGQQREVRMLLLSESFVVLERIDR